MVRECVNCGNPAEKKCAGCTMVWYCSRRCQEYHWVGHLFSCNLKRELTTADHLALAIRKNLLPVDNPTLLEYGFRRAFSFENQRKLLGLYAGLVEALKVKPKAIQRWRKEGILVQEIKKRFEAIPAASRGSYYPWFLENQWVLDGKPLDPEESNGKFLREGWIFTGGDPNSPMYEIKATIERWPKNKLICFHMCGIMLLHFHPAPSDMMWVPFGFCTCDENSELELGGIYEGLLKQCTFKDFYEAFESSQLLKLFRAKGWGPSIARFPYLEGVLEKSPHCLSVWELKQYLILDAEDYPMPPFPTVSLDYGFFNCQNREEEELSAAYRAFFAKRDADPLALQQAVVQGNVFEYMCGVVKLKNKKTLRRLMKNRFGLNSSQKPGLNPF